MISKFFILGGYGQFVWPAFIFAFASCFVLYFQTKKELRKQEKIYFDKFDEVKTIKVKASEQKKNVKEIFSGSSVT